MGQREKDIARLIAEVQYYATLINMKGEHHVFTDDAGHIGLLTIRVHLGGWHVGDRESYRSEIHYRIGEWDTYEGIKREFNKCINTLRKLYRNGRVNHKNFEYEIIETKQYGMF